MKKEYNFLKENRRYKEKQLQQTASYENQK